MLYRLLLFLHAFVGIGALAGGLGAILNPQEPMGASVELLKNSPFNNFLIPGIILFAVIGLGNVISAFIIRSKSQYRGFLSSIFSWALVIWIVVQCIMLNSVHYLHIIYFIIGLIEVILSTNFIIKERLYPANFIVNIYENLRKETID